MSALRFNVVYEDAGEGWVYAHVPELPEVQTQGESLEQARTMVTEAEMTRVSLQRATRTRWISGRPLTIGVARDRLRCLGRPGRQAETEQVPVTAAPTPAVVTSGLVVEDGPVETGVAVRGISGGAVSP